MAERKIIYECWEEFERLRGEFENDLEMKGPYFYKIRERIGKLTKEQDPAWADNISRIITNAISGLSNPSEIRNVICHTLFDEPGNEEESEIFRMADFRRLE
jgi:hypothetical protein